MNDCKTMNGLKTKDNLKTYIFDLDGTLLNTLDDLAASCNFALASFALPTHTLDEVRMFVGDGVRMLMRRAVPQGEAHPDFERILTVFVGALRYWKEWLAQPPSAEPKEEGPLPFDIGALRA